MQLDVGPSLGVLNRAALLACDAGATLTKLSNRHAARSSRSSTEQDRAWALAVEQVERALVRRRVGRTDAREPAERRLP